MTKTIPLRVGICKCTRFYHGKTEGRTMVVSTVGGKKLEKPMIFIFRERAIDDANPCEQLCRFRCHFFLDVHALPPDEFQDELQYNVDFDLNMFCLPGHRSMSEHGIYGIWDVRESYRKRPPSVSEIIRIAERRMNGFHDSKHLRRFLNVLRSRADGVRQ